MRFIIRTSLDLFTVTQSYRIALGSKKYPVELPVKGRDEGPTVEDLANLAAQLAEVPRGSQRLIFKGIFLLLEAFFYSLQAV